MCNCIALTNAAFDAADLNRRLRVPFTLGPTRVEQCVIETTVKETAIKGKQSPFILYASYCPFCGEKYPEHGEKKINENVVIEEERTQVTQNGDINAFVQAGDVLPGASVTGLVIDNIS